VTSSLILSHTYSSSYSAIISFDHSRSAVKVTEEAKVTGLLRGFFLVKYILSLKNTESGPSETQWGAEEIDGLKMGRGEGSNDIMEEYDEEG
jgi:hypothetical protein